MSRFRWLLGLAVLAAACGTVNEPSADGPADGTVATTSTTAAGGPVAAVGVLPTGPSALRDGSDFAEFPDPLVDPLQIISGGPPPDGIPPLESPSFIPVSDATELFEADEAVVALEINGDARAYPVRVMIWHEIVNDSVGGIPVAVTYCPLCNSAVTYDRRIDGVETTFGTSGRLFASALVMYDRATESLWTHFDGRAVVGLLAGHELDAISSPLLSWRDFRAAYPDGSVLDPEATGFRRDYGRNPYQGYDDVDSDPFLFRGVPDDRAAAKQRVVGVALGDEAAAFSLEFVSGGEAKATNATVGETPVVILWKAGQATALEDGSISGGRDVGTVGVFVPTLNGTLLTFAATEEGFVDTQTGTTWSVTGAAISGPLAGERLDRIVHLDTFWFAWATYRPGTVLVEP